MPTNTLKSRNPKRRISHDYGIPAFVVYDIFKEMCALYPPQYPAYYVASCTRDEWGGVDSRQILFGRIIQQEDIHDVQTLYIFTIVRLVFVI